MTSLGAWAQDVLVIRAARIFDGQDMHTSLTVVINGDRIEYAGPSRCGPRRHR